MAICIRSASNINLLIFYLIILKIYLIHQISVSHCIQPQQKHEEPQPGFQTQNQKCPEKCGSIQVPFPFYLNSPTSYPCQGSVPQVTSDVFRLSCVVQQQQQEVLYLYIGSRRYRVIQFFTDGVLVDYLSSASSCTSPRVDLGAFPFEGNDYFGISHDNVVGLFDCQDTSFCKLRAPPTQHYTCENEEEEEEQTETCDGAASACCYPLSDGGGPPQIRADRKGFSVFSQFGCRGFSCWVVVPRSNSSTPKRGIKLEWAIPRNSSAAECSPNAYTINATSVPSGVRCQCPIGFVGDAFAHGLGCLKYCLKDGMEAYGKDCSAKKHLPTKKVKVLTEIVASALSLASVTAICFALRKWTSNKSNYEEDCYYTGGANISIGKASQTRLFSYNELERATKGFDDSQKLVEGTKGALYAGVLGDGSHVAVHRLHKCGRDQQHYFTEDKEVVFQSVEVLTAVAHRNLARVLGCCLDMPPLVVYEYPNYGTLEEHLLRSRDDNINNVSAGAGLEWRKRLKVASETAGLLAFLQHEISPPVIHGDLHPGFIFLNYDFSVKVAGFLPSSGNPSDTNNAGYGSSMLQFSTGDDVYSIGMLLVDLIAGVGERRFPLMIALGKIRSGKVEEILDPLNYHDEHREEIEIVADLAMRCLLFGSKLDMVNVARELMHLLHLEHQSSSTSTSTSKSMRNSNATTLGIVGSSNSSRRELSPAILDETFSNSSLLQMISMSPDSIHVPHFSQ